MGMGMRSDFGTGICFMCRFPLQFGTTLFHPQLNFHESQSHSGKWLTIWKSYWRRKQVLRKYYLATTFHISADLTYMNIIDTSLGSFYLDEKESKKNFLSVQICIIGLYGEFSDGTDM